MKNKYPVIAIYFAVFAAVLGLFFVALIGVSQIPEEKIHENLYISAKYLEEGELFPLATGEIEGSRLDRYADSILLNIIYHNDGNNAAKSVMKSPYYSTVFHEENQNLLMTMERSLEPTRQYVRYWHGSIVLLRPLLSIFDLRKIYIFHAVVMVLLTLILFGVMIRDKAFLPLIGLVIGALMTGVWYVPLSLEYTWVFLIMIIASTVMCDLMRRNPDNSCGLYFMVVGMITNYMDFLTSETLTLFVPLLIMLYYKRKSHIHSTFDNKHPFMECTVKSILAWGAGYVGTWIAKWILAAIVLHQNTWQYVGEHIAERLSGDIDVDKFEMIVGSITRNIGCLFPIGLGTIGAIITALLVLAVAYTGFVYRKEEFEKDLVLSYLLIMLIPYIRYLILHNHSYLHCFFTYRAQLPVILAIVLIMGEVLDHKMLLNKK